MDIDYANVFALTVYGKIGVKVWSVKGEVLGKRDLNPNVVAGGGKEGGPGERQGGFDRREEEVEMTAGAVVVEIEEAAVETVAARVVKIKNKNLKINRFENLIMG